ncbi:MULTISPECIES: DUF2802 domain-containing protein [Gammaproteobacteria]|uniref:DUF2802 domain-containing protein n=1 Tax=Gammaproteobacteria TaxID=1236 RepID=UPI000DD0719D|nr:MULTISPECIES: DUF2802 domain-containing protein [Gammaproteobacteria]RTE86120.1 DUF2802 domain-containing protein [Aliidiomarina sp. B3213]TCZ91473.1 DUF2802 domain-containing protein [Lysobacter sp. N42]
MNAILSQWLPLSLSLAALAGFVVVIMAQLRTHNEQKELLKLLRGIKSKQNEALEAATEEEFSAIRAELKVGAQSRDELQEQLNELSDKYTGLLASHQKLLKAIKEQESAIREVAEQDPASKFYQRAAKLVRQGASLEEVMEACELPRAEAELVFSLYRAET